MKNKALKVLKGFSYVTLIFFLASIIIYNTPMQAYASGWVKETGQVIANYTKFPIDNYQLDFYVDTSWDWLPWQWLEGAVNGVYFAVYLLTNVIWYLTLLLSYFTGFIVEQAYNLDFISTTINRLAENLQNLAGVDRFGLKQEGFFPMLLPWAFLCLGGYFIYKGLLKRQFTKAMSAISTFSIILIAGLVFIGFSNQFLTNINNFSKDMNSQVLKIGGRLTLVNDGSSNENSEGIVGIRENLFNIQVKMPYLILQYDDTSIDEIGVERVESLLQESPVANDSKRADIVKKEVSDGNTNMGFQKIPLRLGMVFLIFILNIVISICTLIISGMKIFAEIMFIIYCLYLGVSFIIALFPGQNNVIKRNLMKMFNSLMTKTGITIVFTIMFSLSTMLYSLSSQFGFIFMIFVQIVLFVGVLYKTNELLGFISLSGNDASSVQSNMGSKVGQFMNLAMLRKLGRSNSTPNQRGGNRATTSNGDALPPDTFKQGRQRMKQLKKKENENLFKPANKMEGLGQKVGKFSGIKDKIGSKKDNLKDSIKNAPLKTKHSARKALNKGKNGVNDFKTGLGLQQLAQQEKRKQDRSNRRRLAQKVRRENAENGKNGYRLKPHTPDKKVGMPPEKFTRPNFERAKLVKGTRPKQRVEEIARHVNRVGVSSARNTRRKQLEDKQNRRVRMVKRGRRKQ